MTYNEMSESFGILSDCCDRVEELLTVSDNGITACVDLTEMHEIDLRRLIELGWEPDEDYEYLYLNV